MIQDAALAGKHIFTEKVMALTVRECEQIAAAVRKAKSVIQLWMWGGPPQLDTFDPKPQAGEAYSGPLRKPLQTNVPGIQIAETLPLLAKPHLLGGGVAGGHVGRCVSGPRPGGTA